MAVESPEGDDALSAHLQTWSEVTRHATTTVLVCVSANSQRQCVTRVSCFQAYASISDALQSLLPICDMLTSLHGIHARLVAVLDDIRVSLRVIGLTLEPINPEPFLHAATTIRGCVDMDTNGEVRTTSLCFVVRVHAPKCRTEWSHEEIAAPFR